MCYRVSRRDSSEESVYVFKCLPRKEHSPDVLGYGVKVLTVEMKQLNRITCPSADGYSTPSQTLLFVMNSYEVFLIK